MSVLASQGRGNSLTEIIRNSFHLCLTEPPSEKAHRLISLPDSKIGHDMLGDRQSPSIIGCKRGQESETRLSRTSECAGPRDCVRDFPLSMLGCYRPLERHWAYPYLTDQRHHTDHRSESEPDLPCFRLNRLKICRVRAEETPLCLLKTHRRAGRHFVSA